MELLGATTIIRKIILEGGIVVVNDGSGSSSRSGAAIRDNDVPLTVFEITSYYDYDHTGYTDFATSSECSACKCQDCKAKHDGVINVINALTSSVKEMTSKRGVIPSKRISYPYTPLEIKVLAIVILKERCIRVYDSMSQRRHFRTSSEIQNMAKIFPTYLDMSGFLKQKVRTNWSMIELYRDKMGNPFDVQYVEEVAQQTICILDYGLFVAAYAEYLSDELQVPNDGLDARLLYQRYAALLRKYGEVKAQKSCASDIKNP
ncbi:hypothetical protein T459_25481 [Capsicum annuum]|uniref:Ubiquitin-like protease family profile domain-containing protein n=1 Tax=Capsicum annuum TaxID=4072 RepID=A0A2G2YKV4_CAPAN|nr:hypothetical protein T459_25481 [Capsicum annuum]